MIDYKKFRSKINAIVYILNSKNYITEKFATFHFFPLPYFLVTFNSDKSFLHLRVTGKKKGEEGG